MGKVTAGQPILAVEDIQGLHPLPGEAGERAVRLHVSGLSMRDAGILDGDYVVAERTPTAEDGEIVVALIDDEGHGESGCSGSGARCACSRKTRISRPSTPTTPAVLGKVIAVVRYY